MALGDGPLIGYGVILLACSVVVLVRLAVVRRRPPHVPPHHVAHGTDPVSAI